MIRVTRNYGTAIAQVFVALMLAIGALLTFWYFEPPPYARYSVRQILTPNVLPGDMVILRFEVTWEKTCYSKLYRNIVDGAERVYTFESEVRLNKRGTQSFFVRVKVPEDASPGQARWEVTTEWFCNPIQYNYPRRVVMSPIHFTILSPTPKR